MKSVYIKLLLTYIWIANFSNALFKCFLNLRPTYKSLPLSLFFITEFLWVAPFIFTPFIFPWEQRGKRNTTGGKTHESFVVISVTKKKHPLCTSTEILVVVSMFFMMRWTLCACLMNSGVLSEQMVLFQEGADYTEYPPAISNQG